MKQKRKLSNAIARQEGLEIARKNVSSTKWAGLYKQNVAGVSLKRVDKSMKYEDNPQRVIQQLRFKNIVVNDGPSTIHVQIKKDTDVSVSPNQIFVGLGKEIGNKTKGKIDFLVNNLGFSAWGWGYLR